MKKTGIKLLAILAIVTILGSAAGCKAGDCGCPKFSITKVLNK